MLKYSRPITFRLIYGNIQVTENVYIFKIQTHQNNGATIHMNRVLLNLCDVVIIISGNINIILAK